MSWNAKVACPRCGVFTWIADTDVKFDRKAARMAGGRTGRDVKDPQLALMTRSVKDNVQSSIYCTCGEVLYRQIKDETGKILRVCGEQIEVIDGVMPDRYTPPPKD